MRLRSHKMSDLLTQIPLREPSDEEFCESSSSDDVTSHLPVSDNDVPTGDLTIGDLDVSDSSSDDSYIPLDVSDSSSDDSYSPVPAYRPGLVKHSRLICAYLEKVSAGRGRGTRPLRSVVGDDYLCG